MQKKYYLRAYSLMLPAVLIVLVVAVYPIFYAVDWSLYNTRYLEKVDFIGFKNYLDFFRNPNAYRSLFVSFVYLFGSLGLSLTCGVGVALILDKPIKIRGLFRTIVIMPWVVSQTINALVWKWLLNANFGAVNYFLVSLHIGKIDFFSTPSLALPTLIFMNFWTTYPLAVVLALAALQTIPGELIESAKIDGASTFRIFLNIKRPLIQPTILVIVILLSLLYWNMVTLIYVSTAGGPLRRTETISVYLFKNAFEDWNIGYAAAIGVVMFIANIIFSLIYIKLLKRETYA